MKIIYETRDGRKFENRLFAEHRETYLIRLGFAVERIIKSGVLGTLNHTDRSGRKEFPNLPTMKHYHKGGWINWGYNYRYTFHLKKNVVKIIKWYTMEGGTHRFLANIYLDKIP